ncbi:MAG: hypothetical protein KDB00_02800 [Planctomycetales bacterium]|nr:hypothetical protein [Planctomycetales bacterium]
MEDEEQMSVSDPMEAQAATLDPPGTIAVVGAGPLGIEAALYGRYLGYNVTLFEAVAVAGSMADDRDAAIPMMPDRCASPLAFGALAAQQSDDHPKALPVTIGQWIDQIWLPLVESDLLRGRLRCPDRVTELNYAPDDVETQETDDEDGPDDDVPPDFQLTLSGGETDRFESVILATGALSGDFAGEIRQPFSGPVDYLFQIGQKCTGDAETDFWTGLKEIVGVYASLGGREDLDLYNPLRP